MGVLPPLRRRWLFCRNPIDLFFQMFFSESNSLQHALAVLNHVRMAAQVSHRVCAVEPPHICIFPHLIVNAAEFPFPVGIIPWTAYCRGVLQPWDLFRKLTQFIVVSKFPRPASAI